MWSLFQSADLAIPMNSLGYWLIPTLVLLIGAFNLLNPKQNDWLQLIWLALSGIALYRLIRIIGPRMGYFPGEISRRWKFALAGVFVVLIIIVACDTAITRKAETALFTHVEDTPHHHVGLLLGTSKFLSSGLENQYYTYRIDAAVALMKAGKIDYLVVSGDNGHEDYNEPETMRNELVAAGIDSTRIVLDYAGFRTLDSVVRLKAVFGQDSVTVISQQFHNERAIYIASSNDIHAIGFNAKDVSASTGLKTRLREKLARVKVFVDLCLGVEPKFYGPAIVID